MEYVFGLGCGFGLIGFCQSVFRLDGFGFGRVILGLFVYAGLEWFGMDEPESLILAQSERWRHA